MKKVLKSLWEIFKPFILIAIGLAFLTSYWHLCFYTDYGVRWTEDIEIVDVEYDETWLNYATMEDGVKTWHYLDPEVNTYDIIKVERTDDDFGRLIITYKGSKTKLIGAPEYYTFEIEK